MSNIEFAARFIPSAFVSGDIYNIFRLDEKHLGFYHIDVSGHGVPAALFCVSIHQRMTHDLHHHGLLKVPVGEPPYYRINPPDRVVAILNEDEMLEQHGRYFTMFYGILNTETAVLSFCRAGHNLPLLIHGNGVAQYLDGGGGPIGFGFPRQPNEGQELNLTPGDCFVIFSDGINEAPSAADRTSHYGMERVQNLLAKHLSDPLSQSFDRLVADVKTFSGKDTFDDDVSIVGFRWLGKG
ncbi:MAG: SpoIIE family protein phosphatase [candidate division KSB1 bacterium]|nr:SpoIIE family protein phosphatase [candidate division KSB1 bacterium]